VAVLIPSIDLMGGKIVQLVQGEKEALSFDNFDYWIERFSKYPIVQLIDLDAARGTGDNRLLVNKIIRRLKCQVGGGIRSVEDAQEFLSAGAHKVIIASALFKNGGLNAQHAQNLAAAVGTRSLVFALDSRRGRVAIDGWRTETAIGTLEMISAMEPFCETFFYTHIETEGLMRGIPLDRVRAIRSATSRRLVVAGGITEQREIDLLESIGADAVVGMALYTGKISG
jgi:phosphoribosylformimino-5-aminoimidazole carboxamide ribotide isomerase